MLKFRRMGTIQKRRSAPATIPNPFSQERHLVSRDLFKQRRSAALAEWRAVMA